MALLGHSDLHIWDNAAFDVSGASCSASPALLPHPRSRAADENRSPNLSTSPLASSVLAGKNQSPPFSSPKQDEPLKLLFKQGRLSPALTTDDDSIVDSEIESILNDIARLSDRLQALRSRKKGAHRKADPVDGVQSQSQSHAHAHAHAHQEEVVAPAPATATSAAAATVPLKQSTKTPKTVRICAPPETAKTRARGVSMCPSEISGGIRLMQLPENPQSRRKSCFWKLPPPLEEEDANVGKVRAHRLSLAGGAKKNGSRTVSPKSRQSKLTDLRRGIVTVGSRTNKLAGKEEAAPSRLQPKKLFGDANLLSAAKPLKNARVVPSRYSQIPPTSTAGRAAAARNSPEKERRRKKEMRGKSQGRMGAGDACGRRKRCGASEDQRSSVSSCTTESLALEEVAVALPKIKAVRLVGESPRDSGCAKRAADLVGKRTYFSCETAAAEDDGDAPICQVLDYDDDARL